MKKAVLLAAVAAGLVALACGGAAPTAVDQPSPVAVTGDDGTVTASAGGKIPISGTWDYVSQEAPVRDFATPGGIEHFFEVPVHTVFTGSIDGLVTATESGNAVKDFTVVVYRGPVEGEVTWAGHTGTVSGMWHTRCELVPTVTCGGTFEMQGSGDLRGVRFHIVWGPGFFPFNYTGFAIDNSR
jgi:hypothetical protein